MILSALLIFTKSLATLYEADFLQWMRETGNMFSGPEYQKRLKIFSENKRIISHANNLKLPYKMKLNSFAHLTSSELNALSMPLQVPRPSIANRNERSALEEIPESIDWRKKGYVSTPKNQGSCGSCWSFATSSAIESLNFMKTGKKEEYSMQHLMNCVSACAGCGGCDTKNALDYIISSFRGHVELYENEPYLGRLTKCNNQFPQYGNLTGYGRVKQFDEADLKAKVAEYGPVIASMKFSILPLHFYSSGIFSSEECMGMDYNHAVVCVGYGSEEGRDFWIVKNSMGSDWGEGGFLRLARNEDNMCGIASYALYLY